MSKFEVFVDAQCVLGEGPRWDSREQVLTWVDIERGRWHCARGDSSGSTFVTLGTSVTFAEPIRNAPGHAAAGLPHGVAIACWASQSVISPIMAIPGAVDGVRMNDSGVDPTGRLFAGSMHTAATDPRGSLYRVSRGLMTPIYGRLTVSNGIGWAPDGKTMYLIDSIPGRLVTFDYDPTEGLATGPRSQFALQGIPDGMAIDSEGGIWIAFWGGSAIKRFEADGTLSQVLPTPVSQPTAIAFGGPDLTLMYVTSARLGLSQSSLDSEPAGAVLVTEPGCAGAPVGQVSPRELGLSKLECVCGKS